MSLDLIKSYLIGIGFDIDKASLETATGSMDAVQKKVEDFSDSSSKGFSETGSSLKGLFSLISSSNTLGSLFPGLGKPLKGLLKDIKSVKDYYDNITSSKKDETTPTTSVVNEKVVEKKSSNEKVKNTVNEKVEDITKENIKNITNENVENIKNIVNENIKSITKEFVEKKEILESKVKEFVSDVKNENTTNTSNLNTKNVINEKVRNVNKQFIEKRELIKDKIKETVKDFTTNKVENKVVETEIIKPKRIIKKKPNNLKRDVPKVKGAKVTTESIKVIGEASSKTTSQVGGLKKGLSTLLAKGGGYLKTLATTSVAAMGGVVVSILTVIAIIGALLFAITLLIKGVKKLASYLNNLANKDIEFEKLSRTLWTTKETAKEVSQALDTLGASMEDLWLSPTLLKQFNELRKDASQLRLPKEFQENLKLVQDVGFEFKRLKQLMSMLFQWIGHYILKYLKGPLTDVKKNMGDINGWLIQNIPKIAEVIGTAIGLFLKFLFILGKTIGFLWKLTHPIIGIVKLLGKTDKGINKLSDGAKRAARIILTALILAFSPLLLVIALIDDVLTFMRGGESVIGDILEWIKAKWNEFIDSLIDKFWLLRKVLNIKDAAKEWWQSYYESASEYFDELWNKAKKVLGDIKEWSKNTFDKGKDWMSDKLDKGKDWIFGSDDKDEDYINMGKKVINFERDYGEPSSGALTQSYMTNTNNSTRTTNNTNEVINKNNINVYGNDASATGGVISKRLTGITSRNLQGAIE